MSTRPALPQLFGTLLTVSLVAVTAASAHAKKPAVTRHARGAKTAAQTAEEAAAATALQARAKFKRKEFKAAATLFMQAYSQQPLPPLVFNAARAYAEGGMTGQAIGLFRLYMTISKSAAGTKTAKAHIAKLQAADKLNEATGSATATKAPETTSERAPNVAASNVGTTSAAMARATTPAVWPRWAVTGASVVGLATGVVLMVSASGDSNDAAGLPLKTDADVAKYNSKFDDAERLWTAGVAVTAIGVGLGVWATWLHLSAGPTRSVLQLNAGPRFAAVTYHF